MPVLDSRRNVDLNTIQQKDNEGNDEEVEENNQSGPSIGIIYPPPEVRNIVDKTASFVARNGPEFEARIRQNELGNPKFNFLSLGDPYHAYYQHKVKDFREGKGGDVGGSGGGSNLGVAMQRLAVTPAAAQRQQELLKAATEPPPPTQAPSEFEFIADPPSISALDLDIVKLTAQFVARNGRQFLTNLMNREQRNYQFDFLRPQHSLFHYFTRLLEQYTKVLLPPKELLSKLVEEASSSEIVLQQAQARAAWLTHQQAQKQRDEQKLEKERIAYASIDWHDFVVVETVDYQPMEMGNFPPPTTPDEVGARVLMQERMDDGVEEIEMQLESDEERDGDTSSGDERGASGEDDEEEDGLSKMEDRTGGTGGRAQDDTQVRDMEEDSSSSSDEDEPETVAPAGIQRKEISGRRPIQPPPLPPQPDKVIVKKYDPKQAKRDAVSGGIGGGVGIGTGAGEEWLISPITGERIPAHKVQEHMRIGLLDPRWLEQRDRALGDRATQDAVLAQGSAIEASLKQLAERRTDIFGVGDEETAIGKKIGEEEVRKDDRVTWDGHTSSVEAATRAARANITLEEQIHQIHKVKGLLPDEEKEKIGPKPVIPGSNAPVKQLHQQHQPLQQQPPQQQQPPPQQPKPIQPPPQPVPMMTGVQGVVPPLAGMMPPLPPLMVMQPLTPLPPPRPPIMGGFPGFPPAPPAPPPTAEVTSAPSEDEPPPKRARTEEQLMPETHFLQLHPGQISFSVVVPSVPERTEWQLTGQRVPLRIPASTSVAALKQRLHQITNMPPAKQKLHLDGLFFKDSNTIAYYNVAPGSVLQLQVKERGGRKK